MMASPQFLVVNRLILVGAILFGSGTSHVLAQAWPVMASVARSGSLEFAYSSHIISGHLQQYSAVFPFDVEQSPRLLGRAEGYFGGAVRPLYGAEFIHSVRGNVSYGIRVAARGPSGASVAGHGRVGLGMPSWLSSFPESGPGNIVPFAEAYCFGARLCDSVPDVSSHVNQPIDLHRSATRFPGDRSLSPDYWLQSVDNIYLSGNVGYGHSPQNLNNGIGAVQVNVQGQYSAGINFALPSTLVVLTHGWQPEGAFDPRASVMPQVSSRAFEKISASWSSGGVAFIEHRWSGAHTFGYGDYLSALNQAFLEGPVLATEIATFIADARQLVPGYSPKIHFIGHSLGSVVNANAVQSLSRHGVLRREGFKIEQFTILDSPLLWSASQDPALADAPTAAQYFGQKLGPFVKYVDNHYTETTMPGSDFTWGFGSEIPGAENYRKTGEYNHTTIHTEYYSRLVETNWTTPADGCCPNTWRYRDALALQTPTFLEFYAQVDPLAGLVTLAGETLVGSVNSIIRYATDIRLKQQSPASFEMMAIFPETAAFLVFDSTVLAQSNSELRLFVNDAEVGYFSSYHGNLISDTYYVPLLLEDSNLIRIRVEYNPLDGSEGEIRLYGWRFLDRLDDVALSPETVLAVSEVPTGISIALGLGMILVVVRRRGASGTPARRGNRVGLSEAGAEVH
jgi:hypothetical protein